MKKTLYNFTLISFLLFVGIGCGSKLSSKKAVSQTAPPSTNTSLAVGQDDNRVVVSSGTSPVNSDNCKTPLSLSLTLIAPSTTKVPIGELAVFELQASGCTGKYRIKGANELFTKNILTTKKYYTLGPNIETITVESIAESNNIVLSQKVESLSFEVVPAGFPLNNNTNNSPAISIDIASPGYRIIPFSQFVNDCTPPAGYLQGHLNFFNPSSSPVSVEVSGNLEYATGPGVQKIDTEGMSLLIAPGENKNFSVRNSLAGYGCHGTSFFYGKIKIPKTQNIVISGSMLTSMPQGTGVQYMTVPFTVSNQGIPSTPPPNTSRQIAFSQQFSYCSPAIMYMQAYVMLYNPSDMAVSANMKVTLTYQSAAGVIETEVFDKQISIPSNATYYNGAYNKKPGYGCHGMATVSGTVTVNNSSAYLQASGNILTSQATSTISWQYMNVPFTVYGALPF